MFVTVIASWEVPHHWHWQAVLSVIHFLPRRGSTFTEGQFVVKGIYTVNNKQQSNADYHRYPEKGYFVFSSLVEYWTSVCSLF